MQMSNAFETFDISTYKARYKNMYSVSHKVEMSERFKGHRTEFKGQNSNLKHVEKLYA